MADTKISDLAAVTSTLGTDEFVLARSGATKKITQADLEASLAPGGDAPVVFFDDVLASPAANFDVTSIPSGYSLLEVQLSGIRSSQTSSTEQNIRMRFNNDTAANYDRESLQAFASTPSSGESLAATSCDNIGSAPAADSPAGSGAQVTARVAGYADAVFHKMAYSECATRLTASSNGMRVWVAAHCWRNTAAITRVTVYLASGNLEIGARCIVRLHP